MKSLCCLLLLLAGSAQWARTQEPAPTPATGSDGAGAATLYDSQAEGGGGLSFPSVFPVALKRNLVARFSIGEIYNNGLQNASLSNANDLYTEASSSFTYNLRRSRSESVIDYRLGARHYNRYDELDTLTHDLGASYIRQLSPHTSWNLNYRFGYSPDFNGGLLQEDLAREFGIINPLPSLIGGGGLSSPVPSAPSLDSTFVNPLPAGVSLIPTTATALPTISAAGDGVQTVRSVRMSHRGGMELSYARSMRTRFFFQAGYQRTRYEDEQLFGTDDYSLSAGTQYAFSPRTSLGISYRAGFNDLDTVLNQTLAQSVVVTFSRQLTRRATLTLSAGPMYSRTRSQESIALPPLLSNLLGQPALLQEVSETLPSWMGNLGISTQWRQFNLSFGYNRSVSSSSGLGGASLQESFSAGLSRPLGRRSSFSLRAVYSQSEFLGALNSSDILQRALSGTFTRQLSSGLDLIAFVNYSKVLRGIESSYLRDHTQAGLRLQINLPRARPM
ncbi:MAG TPA: hypothetical protein VNN17_03315 [Terriglobia bacterium]|nr:hypothetical protein [Terriglobia bacterium]